MRTIAMTLLTVALVGGAASAYAGNDVNDCRSISDSVYGLWGCR